jgi:hypothetical protein
MLLLVASVCIFFALARYLPFGRPTTLLQAAGILLPSCIYLGVAAILFGLLRVPLIHRLFEWVLVRPLNYHRVLLPGMSLLFMPPIILLYLLLLGLNNAPDDRSAVCVLPWLVGPQFGVADWLLVGHSETMEAEQG